MSASRVGRACLYRRQHCGLRPPGATPYGIRFRLDDGQTALQKRAFSFSRECRKSKDEEPFSTRLGKAWRNTKVQWYPIPVGVGIGLLGLIQFRRVQARERAAAEEQYKTDSGGRPPPRDRIRPSGGWQVQVMSTLPLKAISRVWGKFNELNIPYYLRIPGFKLYGWIFGVNFAEIEEPDLHNFPNLAAFFYRTIKPGVRPLDPNPNAILSPADGRVLSFGTIEQGEVEQVKGMTYSLDALLGQVTPETSPNPQLPSNIFTNDSKKQSLAIDHPDAKSIHEEQEFAKINGISYSLPGLFSGGKKKPQDDSTVTDAPQDQSTTPRSSSEAEVRADLATTSPWWSPFSGSSSPSKLYYLVVYLAPGDYHRFHSPVSWVCSTRRHFAGELFSVSPYLQRTLPGLFTLNERVVLLGRWKYGFFSYTSVGATNVGSIKINFDEELRTNSLTTDMEADREAMKARERGEPYSGFSEATYTAASKLLGGYALKRGEEMGGFQLGSSIVLVFEAPHPHHEKSLEDGGMFGAATNRGWKWNVEKGQKVKVGEALGFVEEEE